MRVCFLLMGARESGKGIERQQESLKTWGLSIISQSVFVFFSTLNSSVWSCVLYFHRPHYFVLKYTSRNFYFLFLLCFCKKAKYFEQRQIQICFCFPHIFLSATPPHTPSFILTATPQIFLLCVVMISVKFSLTHPFKIVYFPFLSSSLFSTFCLLFNP